MVIFVLALEEVEIGETATLVWQGGNRMTYPSWSVPWAPLSRR
jgi:hypothetical protein